MVNYVVSNGETQSGIILNKADSMTVRNGGTASTTTVNSGGYLHVSSGGSANNTTVNQFGSMVVSSGASATETKENGGYVFKGADVTFIPNAFSGLVLSRSITTVHSGTTANSTTIKFGGGLNVYSGGTANNTMVDQFGSMTVHSGGKATEIMEKGGYVYLESGADVSFVANTFSGLILSNYGYVTVHSGTTANVTTVGQCGSMTVYSGGKATEIMENGGCVSLEDGADVSFVANTFSELILSGNAYATVHSGTTANNTTIQSYGSLEVFSGGTANNTTVNAGGHLYVYSSGTANDNTINSKGYLYVSSGGTTNNTTVNSGGELFIFSNGIASNTIVNSGGWLGVYENDGMANNTTVNAGGSMAVNWGGRTNNTTVNQGGMLYISSGGAATNVKENGGYVGSYDYPVTFVANTFSGLILSSASATVHSGTTANNTTVCLGGKLHVYSGGSAFEVVENGGYVDVWGGANVTFVPNVISGLILSSNNGPVIKATVHSGTTATYTTVNEHGWLCVYSGGLANNTAVWDEMWIGDGGVANDTTVNSRGTLSLNGVANSTTVNFGGLLSAWEGGIVNNTTVNSGGKLVIYSGGTANNTTVNSGGSLYVGWIDRANSTTVNFGGTLTVVDGTATIAFNPWQGSIVENESAKVSYLERDTNVYYGGSMGLLSKGDIMDSMDIMSGYSAIVYSGGIVRNTKVYAAGTVKVLSGGSLTGKMNFLAGAIISVENGAIMDFNLTQTAAGGKALLTDWSLIQGTPDYTLTVNSNQSNGDYALADGAEDFEGTITVQNTLGESLGILTIGETLSVGKAKYTLKMENESLFLNITGSGPADTTAPTVSNIKASTTKPTSRSVTVTATFKDNIEIAQSLYRIGEIGDWTAYEKGVTVTENTTIYFKAIDTSGNESQIASYSVKNIEKTAPEPEPKPNVADDGWNNWLYDAKTKTTNDAVTDSESAVITSDTWEIAVDVEGISYEDKHGNLYSNFVGYGDVVDFSRIYLENAAKLSFSVMATDAAKITIWRLNETWKKGILTYSQKSLQTTKLTLNKKTGVYSADTKTLLLEAGEYYISVESTNAQKGGSAYYKVKVEQDRSAFFDCGDNGDDWTDMKRSGAISGEYGDGGTVNEYTEYVIKDGWVGYGDTVDYARIHLDDAAKLSFSLDATDAAKFTIYRLTESVKKGIVSYSLKSLQSTTLKKPKGAEEYIATTKALLLESGDYYIAMESTNAKKGGNADYNVLINGNGTAFFTDADDGWNNWLCDKKTKELNEEVAYRESIEITPYTERVQVDADAINHEDSNGMIWDNYVGYGDEYDFAKIWLESDARLSFTITATDAAKFTVYMVLEKVDSWTGVVSYKLETIQSASLKKAKGDSLYRYSVTMMVPGGMSYFVSMQSTNAKKGGCAYYNVEINQKKSLFQDSYYDDLGNPSEEGTADLLTMQDNLNSTQYNEDTLLAATSGFIADTFFEEFSKGILASL